MANYSVVHCVFPVLSQPSVNVTSTTATSISLSWTSAGSEVVYEVMWQRDASGECSAEDVGSITVLTTNHVLMGLEEDSSYTITVTATSRAGSSAVSDAVTVMTLEACER